MAALRDIEKHVLDDAIELIASVGIGNPLMHSMVLYEMQGDRQKVAHFLRGLIGRHVVLVVTRLHALKHGGKTGETASIDSYLHYAEAEALLSAKQVDAFRARRQAIIVKLETAGIKFSELQSFRHAELAHSLHCPTPLTNKLLSLTIWDFASETFELVRAIENAVSGKGRLNKEFQEWLDRGRAFWPESEKPDSVDFETAGRA